MKTLSVLLFFLFLISCNDTNVRESYLYVKHDSTYTVDTTAYAFYDKKTTPKCHFDIIAVNKLGLIDTIHGIEDNMGLAEIPYIDTTEYRVLSVIDHHVKD